MDLSLPVGRENVAWVLLGLIIAVFVVFVFWSLFGAIIVGVFLYYATRPANRWLADRTEHPDVATWATLLLVILPMVLILTYAAFVALQQFNQLLGATNLEEFRSMLQPYLDIGESIGRQELFQVAQGNFSRITAVVAAVSLWMLRLFVMIAVAFYLLRDDFKIGRWFRDTFEDYPLAIDYLEAVDDDLSTLYTGNLLTIVATAAIATATFYILDLLAPQGAMVMFPLLLGLVIGVATLIPAVGMKVVYFPYTGWLAWRAWGSGGGPIWFPVVFFVVTLLVVDAAPDIIVRSYISKGTLNMGLVMLTYVLGAVAWGWYGVFFAPVVLIAAIHFAKDVLPKLVARPG